MEVLKGFLSLNIPVKASACRLRSGLCVRLVLFCVKTEVSCIIHSLRTSASNTCADKFPSF